MTARAAPSLLLVAALAAASGCRADGSEEVWSFERMLAQPRYDPYEPSSFFADGKAMRSPPEGTVPRERVTGPIALVHGKASAVADEALVGADWAEEIPIPVDRALVERGRNRFDVYCAACHGIAGDGVSAVARSMELRPPPSLHEKRLRDAPVGRLFAVASRGFGLMPGYAGSLGLRDRWAVVSYVRALQRSRRSRLAELPDELRRRFEEATAKGEAR